MIIKIVFTTRDPATKLEVPGFREIARSAFSLNTDGTRTCTVVFEMGRTPQAGLS